MKLRQGDDEKQVNTVSSFHQQHPLSPTVAGCSNSSETVASRTHTTLLLVVLRGTVASCFAVAFVSFSLASSVEHSQVV